MCRRHVGGVKYPNIYLTFVHSWYKIRGRIRKFMRSRKVKIIN